jgi:hypothetical protein
MAATNYTPIQLYNSGTTGNAPSAGNLAAGELAINYTDGKLFYKDNSATVQVIAWKTTPTTAGGTGLTSYTAGDLPYYASGTALSKLAIGSANYVLTSSGSAPQYVAQSTLSVGSATNATNTAITDNTSSSATWYPTIVSATTGNLPQTTSSTKLSFVPSTGTLTATAFSGNLPGSNITGSRSISNSVLPAGTILQVVASSVSGSGGTPYFSTTSSSLSNTGLSASITPTSSTSKILIIVSANVFWVGKTSTTDQGGGWGLTRGSTTLVATGFSNFYEGANNGSTGIQAIAMYLDSPSTTSSTTYNYQLSAYTNNGGTTMYMNYNYNNVGYSSITLMEVAQ